MLFFIILISSLIVSFVLPWWIVAILSFLSALLIAKSSGHAFFSAFAAIFIVWIAMALFKSVPNDNILAKRMATAFFLSGHWVLLLIITGFIGGLVSGMAALSGQLIRRAIKER